MKTPLLPRSVSDRSRIRCEYGDVFLRRGGIEHLAVEPDSEAEHARIHKALNDPRTPGAAHTGAHIRIAEEAKHRFGNGLRITGGNEQAGDFGNDGVAGSCRDGGD